jgi:membrane protein YdbS with pleckstrin-like domain
MADDPQSPQEQTGGRGAESPIEPPDGEESAARVEFRPLHPALRKVWILAGLLTALVMAMAAGVFESVWHSVGRSWPLPAYTLSATAFVILAAYAILFSSWRYRAWRYAIRPHDVLLHYGVVWRMRRCIPRLRIQHVDIESGPIDRAFGMVKLTLYTAGTNAAVGTIPGLLPQDAETLRETLLQAERSDE